METFSADRAVELALVERSGFVESRHVGSAVVLDPSGKTVVSLGDVDAPVFARSTLKPFQAIASMKAGAPLRGAQVAIACASHTGRVEHLQEVHGMLEAAGLDESALQCPPDLPEDKETKLRFLKNDQGPRPLCMNCSGKHAAFLWASALNEWPLETYLSPDHPVQQLVVETVAEFTGEQPAAVGVDGCGAPVLAVSLTGLARAYSTLGRAAVDLSQDARACTVSRSMLDYPEYVQGVGGYNTVIMEELEVVAKLGAEGVFTLGTQDGHGVAMKVLDGSSRVHSLVGLNLLVAAGALSQEKVDAVLEKVLRPVTGGSAPVGSLRLAQPVMDARNGFSRPAVAVPRRRGVGRPKKAGSAEASAPAAED